MKTRRRAPSVALLMATIGLSASAGTLARDKPWYKYENAHFIGYSNAAEKQTLTLLDEMERFRAAFLQISNFEVPESAPKTIVLITRNKKEFARLKPSRNSEGFAAQIDDRTIIVMPGNSSSKQAKTTIRHEFSHALLNYREFGYPLWFNEGFAEISSAVEFKSKGSAFTFGQMPERAQSNGPPIFDWDELISDDFMPHAIKSARSASSAYAQASVLVHYTVLGNQGRNAQTLQDYFDLIKAGESSTDAFKAAFGVTAEALWERDLRNYVKKMPYYTFNFRPGFVDLEFRKTEVTTDALPLLIDYFAARSTVYLNAKIEPDPLSLIDGDWDWINYDSACDDPTRISVDTDKAMLTMHRFARAADQQSLPVTFAYDLDDDGSLRLQPLDADPELDMNPLQMDLRSRDLMCLRPASGDGFVCAGILQRCE